MAKHESASIIMAVYNGAPTVERAIKAMLKQDYKGDYEIIVVDDGSTDGSREIIEKLEKSGKVKIRFLNHGGVCRARNSAIKLAKNNIIINMDQDCIPDKKWLTKMVSGFDSEKVGVVSAYGYYGGTSTGFRKELLDKVGGYDEDYGYYREDTDLSFKIMDRGYEFRLIKADYLHDRKETKPKGITEIIRYSLKRLNYHQNDVLLYKKHPTKTCKEFLHIKHGFLIDPKWDFMTATGTWEKGKKMKLSSPRGIVFMENKSPLHSLLIIAIGITYVLAVKASRFIGSVRFRKLLI